MGSVDELAELVAGEITEFVVDYGVWLQKECEKYQLPFVLRAGSFNDENEAIVKQLLG